MNVLSKTVCFFFHKRKVNSLNCVGKETFHVKGISKNRILFRWKHGIHFDISCTSLQFNSILCIHFLFFKILIRIYLYFPLFVIFPIFLYKALFIVASDCIYGQAFIANWKHYSEYMFSAGCQGIGFSLKTR